MKDFVLQNWGTIVTALWACSEVLAAIPGVKSNSIFQLVMGLFGSLTGKR